MFSGGGCLSLAAMRLEKLDAPLRVVLRDEKPGAGKQHGDLVVSIRIAPGASPTDLAQLSHIVDEEIADDLPVVTGRLSAAQVSDLSENPAVVAIRLSRRLRPASARAMMRD